MLDLVGLPKIELHLHLEGAIPHDTMWQLIKKYDPSFSKTLTPHTLNLKFQYTDFHHFLELWAWKNSFIREPEDFTLIGEAVARELLKQNVIYTEAFFSPADFASTGLDVSTIAQSLRKGIQRVKGVEVKLIADIVRGTSLGKADRMLDQIFELKNEGVIGIGLGGDEVKYPPGVYKPLYKKVRQNGLLTTVHAGEVVGPSSIWEALLELNPHRIGHGVRAQEDPLLIDYLLKHQIPLEICPFSNVKTRVIENYSDHPVRQYFQLGIPISVNTDDPALFQTSLITELDGLRHTHGFSDQDIIKLTLDTVQQSFTSDKNKQEFISKINTYVFSSII